MEMSNQAAVLPCLAGAQQQTVLLDLETGCWIFVGAAVVCGVGICQVARDLVIRLHPQGVLCEQNTALPLVLGCGTQQV